MPEMPMKILMVASEAAPFAKTGGLADVTGSLPQALLDMGHQVVLVLPGYRQIDPSQKPVQPLPVPMGSGRCQAGYKRIQKGSLQVYLVMSAKHFDRAALYGEQGHDYPDNAERFALLSRAALELAREVNFAPDVVHVHDWQTSLVPVFMDTYYKTDPFFAKTRTLLTIHNLGYPGIFPWSALNQVGLDSHFRKQDHLEYFGQISLLKGGIVFADRLNTVSPTYCREIQTPEFGMGFDGLLRTRAKSLHGILNGIDPHVWNPSRDKALPKAYSANHQAGKRLCKQALQTELGLAIDPKRPVLAMITRLDPQKGIELVLESWDRLMNKGVQLVILGSGRPDYERRLTEAAAFYPGQAKVIVGFDDALSRRIYAGSDVFLMPSRYEPCGLGQLIAMRYGSVPVGQGTGGLADTIIDPAEQPGRANGYLFHDHRRSALLHAVDRALSDYGDPVTWRSMRSRGMQQDFSWTRTAKDYVKLYRDSREGIQ
jgi:starch synthase